MNKHRKKKREREKNRFLQDEEDESSNHVDSLDSEPVFGMFDQSIIRSAASGAPTSFAMASASSMSMSQVSLNRVSNRTTIVEAPSEGDLTRIPGDNLNIRSVADVQPSTEVPTQKKGRKKQMPKTLPVKVSLAKAKVFEEK